MKHLVQVFSVLSIIFIVACSAESAVSTSSITPPPTLPPSAQLDKAAIEASMKANEDYQKMIEASRQTTVSAAQAQALAAQATIAANQTKDARDASQTLVSGQITVSAQKTSQAQSAEQTSVAQKIAIAKSTEEARQSATAYSLSVSQTVTAQQLAVASATASASQTAIIVSAVQTRTTEDTQTYIEKQTNERSTDWIRSYGSAMAIVIFIVAGSVGLVLLVFKLGNSAQVRLGETRDANDELTIVVPKLGGGFDVIRPGRLPGAMAEMRPRLTASAQMTVGAVDADVIKRDQTVSLVLAAGTQSGAAVDDIIEEPETPEHLAAPNIQISKPFEQKRLPEMSPSRLSLPVGTNENGTDVWVPLPSITHALVAGSSGMGKTRFLHGWIQSLVRGGVASVVLIDGKGGVSFARYANKQNVRYVEDDDAGREFGRLIDTMNERNKLLREFGVENVSDYNQSDGRPYALDHIVAIIDEIASFQNDMDSMVEIAQKARASGIHLIASTQYPDTKTIHPQILANAIVRVSFSVPTATNSVAVLGCGGAQKLGGMPGRMLLMYRGTIAPCQSFEIDVPRPPMKEIPPGDAPKMLDQNIDNSDGVPKLSPNIMKMVRYACDALNGVFNISDVARGVGCQTDEVNAAAFWLEKKGLLTPVSKNERGYNVARHISESLRALVTV